MYKVKDSFVQKFYKSNLSNYEQCILLELAFRCNEQGEVKGVYYKDIIEEIGCSTAQFYNVLESLESKELIIADKSNYYGDWNIIVLSNNFEQEKISPDKYSKFSNLNFKLFDSKEFKQLKAGARRVLLYIIFRVLKQKYNEDNKGFDENKKNKLRYSAKISKYKTIAKEIGISERACKEYINELIGLKFIHVGNNIDINKKQFDVITLLAAGLKAPSIESTSKGKISPQKRSYLHKHLIHFVKTLCRRYKLITDSLNLVNTSVLIQQYKNIAKKKGKDIYNIVLNAIKSSKSLTSSELSSITVHAIVRELINKDYTESILVY